MAETVDQVLFENAHQALVFAFHRSNGTQSMPLMNRLASDPGASGKGLGGLDGVGQAGMILRRLSELEPLHMALLRARYGVRETACPCCHQDTPHHEWVGAIRLIGNSANAMLAMPSVTEALCADLVVRYFTSVKAPLTDVGSRHGVSESTASRANGEITLWLRGPRRNKGDGQGPKGLEAVVFQRADSLLREAGLIE